MPRHKSICAEKIENGSCEKCRPVPLSCSVGKKVVLGLGERTKIKGRHAAPTEVPTCLINFPTTKNGIATAYLKTKPSALLGLHKGMRKGSRGPEIWEG
jgi:hypothetical protein